MILVNKSTGTVLAERAQPARSFGRRLLGLMGRKQLPQGTALVLSPCRQVHTCFMRFPIDILFLDRRGVILKTLLRLAPWKMSPYVRGARQVIELPSGVIAATATAEGQTIDLIDREG